MSFDLIDNMEEKYPSEHFTIDSVYRTNIKDIVDKLKEVIITAKNTITNLQTKINDLEARVLILEGV